MGEVRKVNYYWPIYQNNEDEIIELTKSIDFFDD